MSEGSEGSRRPPFTAQLTARFSRTTIGLAAAAAVVVLAGGILATSSRPAPSATPRSADVAAVSTATPAPSASWAPLDLADLPTIADLTASASDAGGVPTDASFTLTSRISATAVELASRLVTDPALELRVAPGPMPEMAILTPASPLAASTRYRFRLSGPDGTPAGSWAFRTTGPLHAIGFVPDNQATDVPVDTGIEVTFDRTGTSGLQQHFSIVPATPGSFEAHGATWAFVPNSPLIAATVYTISISAGVSLPGSDVTLEAPISWRFETESSVDGGGQEPILFERTLFDVKPGSRALLGLVVPIAEGATPPKTLPVRVYRLPSSDAAIAALRTLETDDWAHFSSDGLVDTHPLDRVLTGDAHLTQAEEGSGILELPAPLPAGWYLVDVPNDTRHAQAVIQVTRLAVYALTSTTRTIAWVNDIVSTAPVADATLAHPGGTVGRTNSAGLLNVATPAALRDSAMNAGGGSETRFLTVRASDGRASIVDLGMRSSGRYPNEVRSSGEADPWWDFLLTDRTAYRPTDTIHVWGLVRSRIDGRVPSQVELRVIAEDGDAHPTIVRTTAAPRSTGAYIAKLAIDQLPFGNYEVEAFVAGELVSAQWFTVEDIRKPAYELTLTPSRHALIKGDGFAVTTRALFFDGSLVPGLDLSVGPIGDGGDLDTALQQSLTTDASGTAAGHFVATTNELEYPNDMQVLARPAIPEEGDISGTVDLLVYPASIWITTTASVGSGGLVVGGRMATVDLAKVERGIAAGSWPDDPSGKALAGRSVHLTIVHLVPVRTYLRTDYDYIEKKAVPVYSTDIRRVTIATRTVTTSATGRFSLSIGVPVLDDEYEVIASATDSKHRRFETRTTGHQAVVSAPPDRELWLAGPLEAHVGTPVDVALRRAAGPAPSGRYLFVVAHQGIEQVTLQSGPSFHWTFRSADLPNLSISAVGFTSTGYEPTGEYNVGVAVADKTLSVRLTPDRARYQPGDQAHVAISTTLHGHAVSADVVVRAVDQKLFAIGAAGEADSIGLLMSSVGSGLLRSYTAQFVPGPSFYGDGYGDAGGGDRGDFRDVATFQIVRTDAHGHASVSFTLPDDLTGWHVSASAMAASLDAGDAGVLLPVGLPFFVEATLAPEYLVGEQPVLQLRAYGDGLPANAPVRFTVSSTSLGLAGVTVDGVSYKVVRVPLPALPAGDQTLRITGARLGAPGSDALLRTFHAVPTRVSRLVGSFEPLTAGYQPPAGTGFATYVVTDAGRGALLPLLQQLAAVDSARFERVAAATLARRLLADAFSVPAGALPAGDFDSARYQRDDGIAVLPYASPSWDTAVRGAIVAGDLLDKVQLEATFRSARAADPNDPPGGADADLVEILAGQAAIGDDVLDDLVALRATTLDTRQEAWLALGFLESGDEGTARQIERQILRAHGQAFGPVVRVDDGTATHDTTAVVLLVAAGLGDPLAASMSRYLDQYADRNETFALEQLGYARSMLDHLPKVAGQFAWTVDGARHAVTLDPGGAFSIDLTPAQQATFRLDPIAGDMTVASLRDGPLTASSFDSKSPVSLTRTVTPAHDAPADKVVTVSILVKFDANAPKGCYRVTDTAPSGLAPLGATAAWPDDSENPQITTRPYDVSGQRVSWCIDSTTQMPLVYAARVVSAGTYTWEPAVIQLESAPSVGAVTATLTYTIR